MEEKILSFEDFEVVPNGSFSSNIPNVESVAYKYEVPNGLVMQLDTNKLLLMKITGYKKATGLNTTSDFNVTVDTDVAEVLDPQTGNVNYPRMAVAFGISSGLIFICSGYNPTTKTLTFSGNGSGSSSEDVDVFYLVGRGTIRFQVTSPSKANKKSVAVFTYSLASLNQANQFHKNEAIYIPSGFILREGFKLEIAVNTPATVLLKAQDISDASYTYNWNDVSILQVPVITAKVEEAQEGQFVVEATNKQLNI